MYIVHCTSSSREPYMWSQNQSTNKPKKKLSAKREMASGRCHSSKRTLMIKKRKFVIWIPYSSQFWRYCGVRLLLLKLLSFFWASLSSSSMVSIYRLESLNFHSESLCMKIPYALLGTLRLRWAEKFAENLCQTSHGIAMVSLRNFQTSKLSAGRPISG